MAVLSEYSKGKWEYLLAISPLGSLYFLLSTPWFMFSYGCYSTLNYKDGTQAWGFTSVILRTAWFSFLKKFEVKSTEPVLCKLSKEYEHLKDDLSKLAD